MTELKYTKEHEWIFVNDNIVTIGITNYAHQTLGDLVYIELPDIGQELEKGDYFAVIESIKAASEIYTPIAGKVIEINTNLQDNPELIKEDLETGWIVKLQISNNAHFNQGLMQLLQYNQYIQE